MGGRPPLKCERQSMRAIYWCRELLRRLVGKRSVDDPLLALRGSGKHLWKDEHADEYVRRLREGWK